MWAGERGSVRGANTLPPAQLRRVHAHLRVGLGFRAGAGEPRGWNLTGIIAGKAIFVTWAIAIPLLVYPWWAVLSAYLGSVMITGLIMATTFQLAHCVAGASYASPNEIRDERRTWAVHEVETTVDFCPHNPALTWMLGGLNFQIEHHLFPKVPHTHYPKIVEIVRRNCAKHGVRYSSHPNLGLGLRSHFLHLREMGRLGLPAERDCQIFGVTALSHVSCR